MLNLYLWCDDPSHEKENKILKNRNMQLKGSRMGHSVKVSLWCVILSTLDFAFLFSNKQLLSAFDVTLPASKWLREATK